MLNSSPIIQQIHYSFRDQSAAGRISHELSPAAILRTVALVLITQTRFDEVIPDEVAILTSPDITCRHPMLGRFMWPAAEERLGRASDTSDLFYQFRGGQQRSYID